MAHYEPGTYDARIVGQRFGETPNGSAYFALEIEPLRATGANSFPEQVYNREVSLFVTEKAAQYTIEKLRSLGFTGTKFAQLDPSHPQFHDFAGTEVAVVCSINDKGYDQWDLAREGGGSQARENDASVASKLDSLFGKSLMTTMPASSEGKSKAKPKAASVAAKPANDEIPF